MTIHIVKRAVSALFATLLASAALIGCQAGAAGESEEVAEAEHALINCKGQCARAFIRCMQSGDDPELCIADRDSCMEMCDEQTCEPSDPGCCQGQPTCW